VLIARCGVAAALLLAACSKEPPPETAVARAEAEAQTVLPCECSTTCRPSPAEPPPLVTDLPDWVSDRAGIREREVWKNAFRDERRNRQACSNRLDVLFPKKEAKP
jgi:hypothetical protein